MIDPISLSLALPLSLSVSLLSLFPSQILFVARNQLASQPDPTCTHKLMAKAHHINLRLFFQLSGLFAPPPPARLYLVLVHHSNLQRTVCFMNFLSAALFLYYCNCPFWFCYCCCILCRCGPCSIPAVSQLSDA